MSWAKLSDDYGDDCWTLSDAAFRLHTEGLTWNGRKLLDCRIPKEDVPRFAKRPEAVQELLDTGWWSDDGSVFVIRHHAAYQRSRQAVLAQQAANQENGKKGGRPKGSGKTQSLSESVSESASALQDGAAADVVLPLGKTHSLTESETERDRTGQDKHLGQEVLGEIKPEIPARFLPKVVSE